jgi:hypothetical protein
MKKRGRQVWINKGERTLVQKRDENIMGKGYNYGGRLRSHWVLFSGPSGLKAVWGWGKPKVWDPEWSYPALSQPPAHHHHHIILWIVEACVVEREYNYIVVYIHILYTLCSCVPLYVAKGCTLHTHILTQPHIIIHEQRERISPTYI